LDGIGKPERTGGDQGRVLAEAVAGDAIGVETLLFEHGEGGDRNGE